MWLALIKLILFDLDDTLFDFTDTWNVVLPRMFAEHPALEAIDANEFFRAFQKNSDALFVHYERHVYTLEQYRNERLVQTAAGFGLSFTSEQAAAFNAGFVERYLLSLEPKPDTQELLRYLEPRYALGIVTNGPHDMQAGKLEKLGLQPFFPADAVWVSHVVGFGKPDRRIYELALARFGVRPEETLFVGDSWEADVAGPLRAGLQAVWLNKYGRPRPQSDVAPLAEIRRLDELIHVLEE